MGVWIETFDQHQAYEVRMSHPVWVCGLKLQALGYGNFTTSHTLYGCVD